MSLEQYVIAEENPNVAVGGGGCLCSPTSCGDGPYVVFHSADLDPLSPHAVLCAGCAIGAAGAVDRKVDEPEDF